MTFICSGPEVHYPPCCSCQADCLDAEVYGADCDPECTWCKSGCPHYADAGTAEADPRCCMEAPAVSIFHPDHPEYMPMGWPRPRSADSRALPTPYIARTRAELGHVNGQRRMLCIIDKRCQVCGEALGDWCVVTWGIGDAVIVDGAAVCPRCWPSALRLCPRLAELWAAGRLTFASTRTDHLRPMRTGLAAQVAGMGEGYAAPDYVPPAEAPHRPDRPRVRL